jgi:hypothetical protein
LTDPLINNRLTAEDQAGWVAERSKAPVLKTGRGQPLVGSNPTPSANVLGFLRLCGHHGRPTHKTTDTNKRAPPAGRPAAHHRPPDSASRLQYSRSSPCGVQISPSPGRASPNRLFLWCSGSRAGDGSAPTLACRARRSRVPQSPGRMAKASMMGPPSAQSDWAPSRRVAGSRRLER